MACRSPDSPTPSSTPGLLALRAERKSPQTLKTYGDGVRFYLDWCETNAVEPLTRSSLNLWVADLLDAGAAAATARTRQLAVRRFSAWLADPDAGERSPGPVRRHEAAQARRPGG